MYATIATSLAAMIKGKNNVILVIQLLSGFDFDHGTLKLVIFTIQLSKPFMYDHLAVLIFYFVDVDDI